MDTSRPNVHTDIPTKRLLDKERPQIMNKKRRREIEPMLKVVVSRYSSQRREGGGGDAGGGFKVMWGHR